MIILGIDPGTAIVGWGVIEQDDNGDQKMLDYGVIRTSKDSPLEDRLLTIDGELDLLLHKHKPDVAAVEELFFGRNVSSVISVAQARGVVLVTLAKNGITIAHYKPNVIKQAVSGYGKATKKQVQEMVKVLLNLEQAPKPDDAADALAVAITHANQAW